MSVLTSVVIATLRGLPRRTARNILKSAPFSSFALDLEFDGLRLRCHPNNNVTERELLIDPAYGRDTLAVAEMLLDGVKPGDSFVDVGANCGVFSMLAARRVGPDGRVVAIEPIPMMAQRLRENAARNGFANIALVETATGAAAGTATFYERPKNFGQSSLHPFAGFRARPVTVRPLLDILAGCGITRVDAMKMDIEGFEDQAIIPMLRSAPRSLWPKRLLIEILMKGNWREDCVAALLAAGYREIWRKDEGDALFRL